MKTFAQIVETLSPAEKEELQALLSNYLIEDRRREIRGNAEAGLKEHRDGKLEAFSNLDKLTDSLPHS